MLQGTPAQKDGDSFGRAEEASDGGFEGVGEVHGAVPRQGERLQEEEHPEEGMKLGGKRPARTPASLHAAEGSPSS